VVAFFEEERWIYYISSLGRKNIPERVNGR